MIDQELSSLTIVLLIGYVHIRFYVYTLENKRSISRLF